MKKTGDGAVEWESALLAFASVLPDVEARALHDAADETDDSHDHDELHAAGAVLESDPIWAATTPYIARWIAGLVELHGIPHESA